MAIKKDEVGVNYGKLSIRSALHVTGIVVRDSRDGLVAWGTLMHEMPESDFSATDKSVIESIVSAIKMAGISSVNVALVGIGGMGTKVIREFMNRGIDIRCIVDKTPIPHNGCRPARNPKSKQAGMSCVKK